MQKAKRSHGTVIGVAVFVLWLAILCVFSAVSLNAATVKYGDVNEDSSVNTRDISVVQKYLAGEVDFSEAQKTAGDVNGDGNVTMKDIALIQKYISDVIATFPVETETAATTATTETTATTATTEPTTESTTNTITFKTTYAEVSGSGATVSSDGKTVTISQPGSYDVYGTITDGQIIVDVDKTVYSADDDGVTLSLYGASITSKTSAAIIVNAISDKCTIEAKKGTTSYLEDASTRTTAQTEINAAVYGEDDISFKGAGTLYVKGNYADGIASKNDIKLKNGIINVTAVDDGIRGKDSIVLEGATVTVNAGGDGLKATNETETDKGFISITSGTLNVTAVYDGIGAYNYVEIVDGTVNVTTTGASSSTSDESHKGIKSDTALNISGGTITVNSTDHALHCTGTAQIDGGTITLTSQSGKGISVHGNLTINNGTINIKKATEGVESKAIFTVNGGTISAVCSDDGFNAGGATGSTHQMLINGGTIYIEASGDGVDANGNLTISGGLLVVNGPTSNGDGSLDSDGIMTVTGGTIIAVGSTGMVQVPGTATTQPTMATSALGSVSAGSIIHIQDASGNDIMTFKSAKTYSSCSLVYSSSKLTVGQTYSIYKGGSYSGGTETFGYCTGGTYTAGTLVTSVSQSSTVVGGQGGFGPGPGPGGRI